MNVIHTTPATSRAESRRELKTEAMLARAMEILEADGLEGLTLQRVAQAMGLVTTAIYRYFPSKDALMAALQRRAVRVIAAHFQSELAAVGPRLEKATPETASLALLLAMADLYFALPVARPEEWRFVALLLGDPRQLLSEAETAKTAPLLEGFLRDMEALFARAAKTKALDDGDASERVFAFWSALHGAHCLDKVRRVSKAAPSVEAIGRLTALALLSSWGATSARISAARRLIDGGSAARKEGI